MRTSILKITSLILLTLMVGSTSVTALETIELDEAPNFQTPTEVQETDTPREGCGPGTDRACEPLKYPSGPKCDPGVEDCDISLQPDVMLRDDAEGNNELSAFFFGGNTLLSPLWKTIGSLSPTLALKKDKPFTLALISQIISGSDIRSIADELLKNTLPNQVISNNTVNGGLLKNLLDPAIPQKPFPPKLSSGVFPLGYQYELDSTVEGKLKTSATNAAEPDKLRYIPSYKYMIRYTGDTANPYINVMDQPVISDALDRMLRVKGDYKNAQSCLNAGDCTDTAAKQIPSFVEELKPSQTYNRYSVEWLGIQFPIFHLLNQLTADVIKPSYIKPIQHCIDKGGHVPTAEQLAVMAELTGTAIPGQVITSDMGINDSDIKPFSFIQQQNQPVIKAVPIKDGMDTSSVSVLCVFD